MSRVFTPKVGKHVTYWTATTRKPKSATITAVTSATVLNLRIGRAQTLVGIVKRTAKNQTNVWSVSA
jgi:hypothetical protein